MKSNDNIFKNVLIAADHVGMELKNKVMRFIECGNYHFDSLIDLGAFNENIKVDYPVYARFLSKCIQHTYDVGILICGSGIGMSIAANRFKHIRAALVHDVRGSFFSRSHSDANVLVLSAELLPKQELLEEILKTFFSTTFAGGRHCERLKLVNEVINY